MPHLSLWKAISLVQVVALVVPEDGHDRMQLQAKNLFPLKFSQESSKVRLLLFNLYKENSQHSNQTHCPKHLQNINMISQAMAKRGKSWFMCAWKFAQVFEAVASGKQLSLRRSFEWWPSLALWPPAVFPPRPIKAEGYLNAISLQTSETFKLWLVDLVLLNSMVA